MARNRAVCVPLDSIEEPGADDVCIAPGVQPGDGGISLDRRRLPSWSRDARAADLLARTLVHRGIDDRVLLHAAGIYVRLEPQGSLFQPDGHAAAQLVGFVEPLDDLLQRLAAAVRAGDECMPFNESDVEERFGCTFDVLHETILAIASTSERVLHLGTVGRESIPLRIPPLSRLRRPRSRRPSDVAQGPSVILRMVEITELDDPAGVAFFLPSAGVDADIGPGKNALLLRSQGPVVRAWRRVAGVVCQTTHKET